MYPRSNQTISITILVTDIVKMNNYERDIILLNVDTNLHVLKPYFSTQNRGDMLAIIGCEYKDEDCNQKAFKA